jgi:hypothetical protein
MSKAFEYIPLLIEILAKKTTFPLTYHLAALTSTSHEQDRRIDRTILILGLSWPLGLLIPYEI